MIFTIVIFAVLLGTIAFGGYRSLDRARDKENAIRALVPYINEEGRLRDEAVIALLTEMALANYRDITYYKLVLDSLETALYSGNNAEIFRRVNALNRLEPPEISNVPEYSALVFDITYYSNRLYDKLAEYNAALRSYNQYLDKFPNSFFAGVLLYKELKADYIIVDMIQ